MSTYQRLFLWFCGANLLTLVMSVWVAHAIFERGRDRAPQVATLAAQVQAALTHQAALPADAREAGRRIWVLRDGQRLLGGPLPRVVLRHLDELLEADTEIRLPRDAWLVSRTLADARGRTVMIVWQAPARAGPWARWLAPAVQILLSVLAIAAVGWIVARRLAAPLQRIQQAMRRFASGALDSRADPMLAARSDEYGRLAQDFDRMAEQIESLVQARDRLLHDVSHELRAPLSRLRFALELARDRADAHTLERADREIARMDALVGQLLALARLEHAAPLEQLPNLDLHALAQDVVDAEAPQAAHRAQRLEITGAPLRAQGDAESLRRALENLVRNALRHAPDGSCVQIDIGGDATLARISVRDRGPGVTPQHLARLFDPFFRAGREPGEGHGLGLTIVARVMRAHRGRAEARLREGGGLEVSLCWPRLSSTMTTAGSPAAA